MKTEALILLFLFETQACFSIALIIHRNYILSMRLQIDKPTPPDSSFMLETFSTFQLVHIILFFFLQLYSPYMKYIQICYTKEFLCQNQYSISLAPLSSLWVISQISNKDQVAQLTSAKPWVLAKKISNCIKHAVQHVT